MSRLTPTSKKRVARGLCGVWLNRERGDSFPSSMWSSLRQRNTSSIHQLCDQLFWSQEWRLRTERQPYSTVYRVARYSPTLYSPTLYSPTLYGATYFTLFWLYSSVWITPDSCGKAGDPHNLEGGTLVSRNSSISISSAAAISMLAGTSLPMRLAAAPRMLSSLLNTLRLGPTRPAPREHTIWSPRARRGLTAD